MQKNWKHVLPFALTALVSFTSVVSADSTDSAHMRNLENRVNALEQRKGAGGMINPQGRPQVRDGVDMFIFGDLLYWNAHEDGLNMAVKQRNTTVDSSEKLNNAVVNNIHGKWNWGFRTGFGYNTPHDGWDFSLTWLRFTDTGHKSPSRGGNIGFYPTTAVADLLASNLGPNAFATRLDGYWSMNLNQLDLDLGREFFVSKWLTLRPHMGLRADWIHQKLKTIFAGFDDDDETAKYSVRMKDHWFGLGLEGGLDTQWGIGRGWSVFGNIATAIVYGFHQIRNRDTVQEGFGGTLEDPIKVGNVFNSYRVSHAILDMEMGFRWDYMFSNDRFHLGFDLGWEHHIYFDQNQFPVFSDDFAPGVFTGNQGNLTMQGWTFSARFDF